MSNIGRHVIARNAAGVRLIGRVTDEVFIGGSSIVALDLEGTTSNVHIDYDDFTWQLIGTSVR